MDGGAFVVLFMAIAFWCPLLYVLVQGSAKEWAEGLEAFTELVDEVTTEPSQKSWFPRIEGRWGGRAATLRVALGGGWIFALETKASSLPKSAPEGEGLASAAWRELEEVRRELGEWRNRGTLRVKGGRLEAYFPQEAQFSSARLQRAGPLVARAALLLDRITGLEAQRERIRCPYCHDSLEGGAPAGDASPEATAPEPVTICEDCQTPHHSACYAEAGCTILGCSRFGQRAAPPERGQLA